jgi:hypothetical protein
MQGIGQLCALPTENAAWFRIWLFWVTNVRTEAAAIDDRFSVGRGCCAEEAARCVRAAAMLPESDRKDLAIQALARSTTISDLSVRHSVSRKFVYRQTHKAGAALDEVCLSDTPEDDVLFHLTVSKTWLRRVVVALTLICRSSYRDVVEFLRDLLGRAHQHRHGSSTIETYRASLWACMVRSSRVHCR